MVFIFLLPEYGTFRVKTFKSYKKVRILQNDTKYYKNGLAL
jgi:hypothetical protein